MESPDSDWLETPEGCAWLETTEGAVWIITDEGLAWSRSESGERFFDARLQRCWDNYFAGRLPSPPEWVFTPDTAPPIGSRVRFLEEQETGCEDRFEVGELAIVEELTLGPIGAVTVSVRTVDGRTMKALHVDTFEAATS